MLDIDPLLKVVAALPQSQHISRETAERWISGTARVDPSRLEWHLRRAGGFGGSDIGALIASSEGRFHVFSSAHEIVRAKLLRAIPDGETDDTRRGSELEPFIRSVFERRMERDGRVFARRDDLKARIQCGPHPDLDWHLSSPDEIYDIDGKICVVDFKAPTTDMLEQYRRYGGYDDYVYQTHHYALGAIGKGIFVDRMMLAMYDYKRNDVEVIEVEKSQQVFDRTIEIGEFYWREHVLKGVVPKHVARPRVEMLAKMPAQVRDAAERFVINKIVASHSSEVADDARKEVESWIAENGPVGEAVLTLGLMEIRASAVMDVDSAVERLADIGLPIHEIEGLRGPSKFDQKNVASFLTDLLNVSRQIVEAYGNDENPESIVARLGELIETAPVESVGAYDPAKIEAALVSCSERPHRFVREKLSSTLPRGKRQDLLDRKEDVGAMMERMMTSLAAPAVSFPHHSEPGEGAENLAHFGF